ncbi:pilus assembly protein TadG-related protein [Micromonospora aurantiaca (nom. illeg.)]|uniref:pilus assembly protein TadG-related protein n=1 Tax=Micromonospora aurantiaca (nom. illeg.) TaxID=47850 RepID=UPI0035B41B9A
MTGRLAAWARRLRRDDRGQITPWTVVGTLIVLILAGLVFDQGMAMAAKVSAYDTAQAAARAGAREIDLATYRATGAVRLDPAAAATAARVFLDQAGLPGRVSATTEQVTVTVTTQHRTRLLHLVGITAIPVLATATATPATGVTTAT